MPAVVPDNDCLQPLRTSRNDRNGEIGIDPTAVNVNINLSLQLKTDEAANDEVASRADAETGYRHRIIVDAYLNRILSKRQVVYKELTEAAKLDMELNLKLHARDYQLVIWADYVSEDSDDDLSTTPLRSPLSSRPKPILETRSIKMCFIVVRS